MSLSPAAVVQRLRQCEGCRRRRERVERVIRRAREASAALLARRREREVDAGATTPTRSET